MSIRSNDSLWMRQDDVKTSPKEAIPEINPVPNSVSRIGNIVRRLLFCVLAAIPASGCDVDISSEDFSKNPMGFVTGKGNTSISLVCDTDFSYVYVDSDSTFGDANLKFDVCKASEECKFPSGVTFIPYGDGECCANSPLFVTAGKDTHEKNCEDGCFPVFDGGLHVIEASSCGE